MKNPNSIQLEQIYQSLAKLDVAGLDKVMEQLISLRKQKMPSVLPEKETVLLRQINKTAPADIQERYNSLRKKRIAETLTSDEHKELLELTSYMEKLQNERLANMIELASLRNLTLDELIEELQLKIRFDVV